VFSTLDRNENDLFNSQLTLLIESIVENEESGTQAINLTMDVINKFIERSLFERIAEFLIQHQESYNSLLPEYKLKLMKDLSPILTSKNFPENQLISLIPWLGTLAKPLNDEDKDTAAVILFNLGNFYQKKKKIKNAAHEEALKVSEGISNTITMFKLLEAQFRNEFGAGEYIRSLEILDDIIEKLTNQTASKELAINFIDLLNELLPDLGRRKKKKWLDLFTEKYQIMSAKFLGEKDKVSTADEQYSEQLLDEMMDFTSKKDKK
jgi:hypothetical protein